MSNTFRIAIAGLGTVGGGLVELLQKNSDVIQKRVGKKIEIVAVSGKNKKKKRKVSISDYEWVDNPLDFATRDDVDCIVEVIGGSKGAVRELIKKSLENKKHVVTANKAIISAHGFELAKLAEKNGVCLSFEASVSAAIPIIKALKTSFAANNISSVYGILNGTCNYILTRMREDKMTYNEALKEAKKLGYAEADSSLDVKGIDSAQKLSILTSLAFGVKPGYTPSDIIGIKDINPDDIFYAQELGYNIKLVGIAKKIGNKIMQVVEPCLVPEDSPLGRIEGIYNGIYVRTDFAQTPMLSGVGGGAQAAASAIAADIMDIVQGARRPTFGLPTDKLEDLLPIDRSKVVSRYYVAIDVLDEPGVIADVASILRDNNVSVESFTQLGRDPGKLVAIVLRSHMTEFAKIEDSVSWIADLAICKSKPRLIRIIDV
ncbi:MAG: homoserine dehydrogenase [Alphaproteobacteria bacterium]|nr:homoserine dehydrogenase [Alphaproteobacteria bacterium]